ncbi:hypothetical protein BD414DRAFT_473072 [Trametes punicea]|nr:hypothetical protein BD414DRAFT_473072 [Trametes punicea]
MDCVYAETKPLLSEYKAHLCQKVEVVPMRRVDTLRGADTMYRAFTKDSLMLYFAAVDTAPFRSARIRANYCVLFDDAVRKNHMFTVNCGEAVLRYRIPGEPRGMGRWHTFLANLVSKFDTRELIKRKKEFVSKVGIMVKDAFGERVAEMYEIGVLGTAPEAQGRGYGSALVTKVTDMGDAEGRDVWVVTADAYSFYETLGFITIRTMTLGTEDPKWDGKPVMIYIMYRPAKTTQSLAVKMGSARFDEV